MAVYYSARKAVALWSKWWRNLQIPKLTIWLSGSVCAGLAWRPLRLVVGLSRK
jgi:hypothetical protein